MQSYADLSSLAVWGAFLKFIVNPVADLISPADHAAVHRPPVLLVVSQRYMIAVGHPGA